MFRHSKANRDQILVSSERKFVILSSSIIYNLNVAFTPFLIAESSASNCACMVTFSSFKSPPTQLLDQTFQVIISNHKILKNTCTFVLLVLVGFTTSVCKQTKIAVSKTLRYNPASYSSFGKPST